MEVCHIIPLGSGGAASAATSIANGDKKIFYNNAGYTGTIRAALLSVRLRFIKCDILHFHDSVPGYFYTLLPHKKKIVYTSHGHWLGYFSALRPCSIVEKTQAWALVHIQNCMIKRADVAVAVSRKVKSLMKDRKNSVVIYNGVDTRLFRPPQRRNKKISLWVGDNAALKGLEKAIKMTKERRMKLLVVGVDGTDTDNVKYLGKIEKEKMPQIYKKASLLIYPSRWDGHPLVPLEAMASGCDVLASENSNLELAKISDGWYRIPGRIGRKIAERNTWTHVRKEYEKVYDTLFQ